VKLLNHLNQVDLAVAATYQRCESRRASPVVIEHAIATIRPVRRPVDVENHFTPAGSLWAVEIASIEEVSKTDRFCRADSDFN
jgi:hypothetical protein